MHSTGQVSLLEYGPAASQAMRHLICAAPFSFGPMAPATGTSLGDVLSLSYLLPQRKQTFLPGNPSLGGMVLVGFYLSGLKHLNCFGKCQGEGYFLRCRFVLTRNRIGNRFPETSLGTVRTDTGGVCLLQGQWSLPDLEG